MRRLGRWAAGLAAAAALLLALGIGAFRLMIDLLPGYQQRIVEQVRVATGLLLEFDSVHARIGRYGPEVVFRGARVRPASGEGTLITADAGRVSLSIPRSIWYRRLEIGRVVLVRPHLHFVIHTDGTPEFVGQQALQAGRDGERRPLSLDRLPRGRFAVRDATIDVLDLRARQGRFELTGASAEMERRGRRLELSGQLELPEHLGSSLEFEAEAQGALADTAALVWRASVDARGLDFEQWSQLLPESFKVPAAGNGSIRAMARGTGRRLDALRLEPELANLRLAGAAGEFTRIAGELRLRRETDGWSLQASGLELVRPGAPWRPSPLAVRLVQREGRFASLAARAGYLRIENLAALAPLLPAGTAREKLEALAPHGELYAVDLTVTQAGPKRLPDIRGRLRFADLGFEPLGKAPGFSGLDGSIEGQGEGGIVQVATRDALMSLPQQWRALAEIRRADGRVEWSRFGEGVRLWLDDGTVDTGHGRAIARVRMLVRPDEPPLMDVQGRILDVDPTQAWRYLPIGRLKPRSLGWLDAAFRGGRITQGTVSVTGPTKGFPYRDGEGKFEARVEVRGLRLFYAPGWPEMRGIDADVAFEGPGMRAAVTRGSIAGLAVTQAEAASADFRESIVAVRGSVSGDAGRAIRFLQDSPLAASFTPAFAGLSGSGPVAGEVVMVLPIRNFDQRVITVTSALNGVTLRYPRPAVEITNLTGDLWVRNREVQAPSLAGRVLGGPVRMTIQTTAQRNGDLSTAINAQGNLKGAELQPVARLPLNAGLAGSTDWRGFLTIERSADRERPARGTLRLSSDLRGLESKLPEPFAKPADSSRPLTVSASFGGEGGPRIQAQLGRDLHALLQWRRNPADPPVERGIVSFGSSAPATLPRAAGLWLTGRLESASLTDLLNLKWPEPRGRPLNEWLGGADLSVGRLEVLGYRFDGTSGRLRPGNRAWEVDVTSEDASGHLSVPFTFPGEVPMVLDLERLHFGEPVRVDPNAPEPDPRKLPAMRADIRDFAFAGYRFGHTRAEFARGTAGMTLNEFTMEHAAFTAKGRGSWLMRERGAECRLEFEAQATDVMGMLEAMQMGSLVAAPNGRVSASLTWPGAPERTAIGRLSGRLEIAAENGRLTSVEPGAGRIFGLMSLAHLPRRLALDFGDLTGEGLAFDTLRGTFQLTNGEAFTDNLTLRGSAAEIGLAGRTSLRDRTYDQTAVVTGQLGASLGVGGALAGGPAVGAALLLFSQIFKEPLKGMTRGYYRITGSWDDPQVRRIDAREMKDNQQAGQVMP